MITNVLIELLCVFKRFGEVFYSRANLHVSHYVHLCVVSMSLCISSSVVTFIWPWLAAGSLLSGGPLSQID